MMRPLSLLLDLFFPPKCIYCHTLLHSSQQYACPCCLARLSWIKNEDRLSSGTHFSHCVSVAWYEDEIRKALLQYKFFGHRQYAQAFALPLAQAVDLHFRDCYDLISWVPISQETLKTRGYDQARLLAKAVAQILRQNTVPLFKEPLHKTPQSTLSSAHARRQNVKGCFTLIEPTSVQQKRILLIDDVITTGSTMEESATCLFRAGAKDVLCATFCRTRPTTASLHETASFNRNDGIT